MIMTSGLQQLSIYTNFCQFASFAVSCQGEIVLFDVDLERKAA